MLKLRGSTRFLLYSLAVLTLASDAASADVIRVSPGPNGSSRITTPWGQYIAVTMGDHIWVGSEAEWNGIIADQVARDSGARRIRVVGERAGERTYVDASLPSTRVGATTLNAISTSIVFGVPASRAQHRPPRPVGAEYVNISWTPSDATPTRAMLTVGQRTIAPNDCGADQSFRYCEFTAQRTQLSGPARVVFLVPGRIPAVLPFGSLARESFDTLAAKYRAMRDLPVSQDDQEDVRRLHALDAAVPVTLSAPAGNE